MDLQISIERRSFPFQQTEQVHLDQAPQAVHEFIAPAIFLDATFQDVRGVSKEAFLFSVFSAQLTEMGCRRLPAIIVFTDDRCTAS
jgi:hypothetical protein